MTRFFALVAFVSFTSNGCNYGVSPTDPTIEADGIEILPDDNPNPDDAMVPSIIPDDPDIGSVTLADHAAWHTSVKICPRVQVDNADFIVASVRILHPDGTVSRVNSGDGQTQCVAVPLGGPYEISLPDECRSLDGRLVMPLGRMYRETYDGARTRRAPKFECYVRIGGG